MAYVIPAADNMGQDQLGAQGNIPTIFWSVYNSSAVTGLRIHGGGG